jgi:hypothetical protein
MLLQLIPLIIERYVVKDVVVVIAIDPLTVFEPIMFPFPGNGPPILIPEPLVSIPINTFADAATVGTAATDISVIVFPVITEPGKAPVVVNNIP